MGITNRVATLCFDTTAANTGRYSGACTIIEQRLGRTLLFLACRYHIAELVVGAAFELTSDASTGPEVLLYKRFRKHWKNIEQTNFKPASTHDLALVASAREDIINFAKVHLEVKQPRDDYHEFLELSIIFLGVIPERGVRFQVAGFLPRFQVADAMHLARWMAKDIYAIKIHGSFATSSG